MSGLFHSASFADPQLGELRRSGGLWRGTLFIGEARVPLALSGSRAAPDPKAVEIARSFPTRFPSWRPEIGRALFEHYSPYAEAVASGEAEPPESGLPAIAEPSALWPHATVEFIQVTPLGFVYVAAATALVGGPSVAAALWRIDAAWGHAWSAAGLGAAAGLSLPPAAPA